MTHSTGNKRTTLSRSGVVISVEVFKNREFQSTKLAGRFPPPSKFVPFRQFVTRCRRDSFQVLGFLSNKGDPTIVHPGA